MSDEKPGVQRQIEEVSADMLKSRFERIANSLRRLADGADAASGDVDDAAEGKRPNYSDIAARVQHEVLWGLANLGLDALISAARDADDAKGVQRIREKIAAEVESVIGGYPENEAQRPRVEVGLHLNDAEWAAAIARRYGEG
jgi:hypothetical protein